MASDNAPTGTQTISFAPNQTTPTDLEAKPEDADNPAPVKRKGGRKPIYATPEERKQRNRQAQAAFRGRRSEYIKQLEVTIKRNEDTLQSLQQAHRNTTNECHMLRYRNSLLESILIDNGLNIEAELQARSSPLLRPNAVQPSGSEVQNLQQAGDVALSLPKRRKFDAVPRVDTATAMPRAALQPQAQYLAPQAIASPNTPLQPLSAVADSGQLRTPPLPHDSRRRYVSQKNASKYSIAQLQNSISQAQVCSSASPTASVSRPSSMGDRSQSFSPRTVEGLRNSLGTESDAKSRVAPSRPIASQQTRRFYQPRFGPNITAPPEAYAVPLYHRHHHHHPHSISDTGIIDSLPVHEFEDDYGEDDFDEEDFDPEDLSFMQALPFDMSLAGEPGPPV